MQPGLVLSREHGLFGAKPVYPTLTQEQRVSPRAVSRKEEESSLSSLPWAKLGWPTAPFRICSSPGKPGKHQTNLFWPQFQNQGESI